MKTFSVCAALALSLVATTFTTVAFADEGTAPAAPAKAARPKAKAKKKKPASSAAPAPEEKLAPPTEAAAPSAPETAAVPLETLPPPPPPAPPAVVPAAPAAPAPDPDRTETSASSGGSTRIEAVVGRTQTFGFAVGLRVGHRMANNVYVGGAAMVQTGIEGAILTYPAAELGYDAKLGDARFMPYVGIGPMIAIPTEGEADVQVTPVVYPGFALRYESDKTPLIGGADVRFLYLTDTDSAAVAFNLTTGVRF